MATLCFAAVVVGHLVHAAHSWRLHVPVRHFQQRLVVIETVTSHCLSWMSCRKSGWGRHLLSQRNVLLVQSNALGPAGAAAAAAVAHAGDWANKVIHPSANILKV